MKTNGNDPIASGPISVYDALSGTTTRMQGVALTKREHFAGLAMRGMLSDIAASKIDQLLEAPKNVALWAVICADELIAALNKEVPGE